MFLGFNAEFVICFQYYESCLGLYHPEWVCFFRTLKNFCYIVVNGVALTTNLLIAAKVNLNVPNLVQSLKNGDGVPIPSWVHPLILGNLMMYLVC